MAAPAKAGLRKAQPSSASLAWAVFTIDTLGARRLDFKGVAA